MCGKRSVIIGDGRGGKGRIQRPGSEPPAAPDTRQHSRVPHCSTRLMTSLSLQLLLEQREREFYSCRTACYTLSILMTKDATRHLSLIHQCHMVTRPVSMTAKRDSRASERAVTVVTHSLVAFSLRPRWRASAVTSCGSRLHGSAGREAILSIDFEMAFFSRGWQLELRHVLYPFQFGSRVETGSNFLAKLSY